MTVDWRAPPGDATSTAFASRRVIPAAPQRIPMHVDADLASEPGAGFLVEAEVDAAIDARVVDVVRDLAQVAVLERHPGERRIVEHDEMMAPAKGAFEHLARRGARAAMRRGVARKARRGHERFEVRIAARERIAVGVARANRGF